MEIVHKITHAIIINQIALNRNEAIKHTPHYKKDLKNRLNLLLKELIKAEPEFDAFFNNLESETNVVYDTYDEFLKAVASVPIWDCQNITHIINAYKQDPKSIEGICRKILKK